MKFTVQCLTSSMLGLVLISSQALAGDATPEAGTYIREAGSGQLVVRADGSFQLLSVGGNAHTCELSGRMQAGVARMVEAGCEVHFSPAAGQVTVSASDEQACRYYCGARAWFGGDYRRPPAQCRYQAMRHARVHFKRLYDAGDYREALSTLAPVLEHCGAFLSAVNEGWMRNDLALAQLRAGDIQACRQTLAPLAESAAQTDEALNAANAPLDAEALLPMLRATRTNLKLCSSSSAAAAASTAPVPASAPAAPSAP